VAREPGPGERLLARLAATIPGAADPADGAAPPGSVAEAARAELKLHEDADRSHREAAAARARARLDDAELLFGTRIRLAAAAGTDPFPAPRNPR
jgi:hypothetical protein